MIGWTRTTAIMKPLRRPERTPTASDAPMIETGSDHPFGTSTAATSALTRPASGPTERSMPPSPESTGAVCAIAMTMNGTAPTDETVPVARVGEGVARDRIEDEERDQRAEDGPGIAP